MSRKDRFIRVACLISGDLSIRKQIRFSQLFPSRSDDGTRYLPLHFWSEPSSLPRSLNLFVSQLLGTGGYYSVIVDSCLAQNAIHRLNAKIPYFCVVAHHILANPLLKYDNPNSAHYHQLSRHSRTAP